MAKANLEIAASNEVKIEKGVPVPSRRSQHGHVLPWDQMEVGDSFAYPFTKAAMFSSVKYRNSNLIVEGSTVRFKASSKNGELRIWRIS